MRFNTSNIFLAFPEATYSHFESPILSRSFRSNSSKRFKYRPLYRPSWFYQPNAVVGIHHWTLCESANFCIFIKQFLTFYSDCLFHSIFSGLEDGILLLYFFSQNWLSTQ
jgi:hypothetical protein